MVRAFCRPHAYTFNEQSKMATALTPQTDVTSEKVTWLMENPRQQSRPAYRKYNLKLDFDGHFAYLKTLNFSFKQHRKKKKKKNKKKKKKKNAWRRITTSHLDQSPQEKDAVNWDNSRGGREVANLDNAWQRKRMDNNNTVHLSCAHQRPERSHDTY